LINNKVIALLFIGCFFCIDKIDINNTSYNQIASLPLAQNKVDDIWLYVNSVGELNTIYDLLNVNSLDAKDIKELRKYILINKREYNTSSSFSYKTDQWLASEGSSEGIAELWLDRYYDPQNINSMNYDDLSSLPNFSPMDVVAVLKQQKRGEISGTFQLKNSPGISYYGYKNLLDFIKYSDTDNNKINIRYTSMVRSIPSSSSLDEDEIPVDFTQSSNPETLTKLLIGYKNYNFGVLRYNHIGEPSNVYTDKAFLSLEKINFPLFRLDKLIIGNFTAAYGQGVVFESTDFYQPRRSGYKFSKRQTGISTDFTRSTQFVLSGLAAQFSTSKVRLSMFLSNGFPKNNNMRDAVINADGSFSSLITMNPRLGYGYSNNELNKINENLINSLEEWTYGLNLRYSPNVSTNFGITFYESLYDRVLDPQVIETIIGGDGDIDGPGVDISDYDDYSGDVYYLNYMSNSADPEINAMYSSSGSSPIWDDAKSFRRVIGYNFSKVIKNMVIQGELGQMDTDGILLDNEPKAYVINSYMQFNTFDFLVLYRDYDIDFDNPYQRSFSEYKRYKSTIFEDPYWLEDPIYYNLYSSNAQPQAERGIYIQSRYQFHEDLVGGIQWDSWVRKADEAQYFRIVGKLEWRPLFNYRIYFRYKWQSRGAFDIAHPSPYFTKEARIRFKLRLSNYNSMELLYSWNYTTFSPRPRLTGSSNLFDQEMHIGDIGTPDGSIGFSFEHNFDKSMKLKTGFVYAEGFMWYIEDNDFRLFDTNNGLVHSWVSFNFKPNPLLAVKLKVSHSSDHYSTTIVGGQLNDGSWIENPYVINEKFNYRIQIDYAL
tara:strand:+ start:442 stop:2916 length:2475 start_codon:yes stop_codon:yes gene_type:complete